MDSVTDVQNDPRFLMDSNSKNMAFFEKNATTPLFQFSISLLSEREKMRLFLIVCFMLITTQAFANLASRPFQLVGGGGVLTPFSSL